MNKKTSLLGDVLFIIILIIIIFLFFKEINNNKIELISKINKEFNIDENNLFPEDNLRYIAELNKINNEYSRIIVQYINIEIESRKIDKLLSFELLNNKECISNKVRLKVNDIILKEIRLQKKLEEYKINKSLKKIYWNKYLDNLKQNIKNHKNIKLEITISNICE